MRNFMQANSPALCCEQVEIQSAGLSRPIPIIRPDPVWRQFQSSIVRAFVRRQRREALRARLIGRAVNSGYANDE